MGSEEWVGLTVGVWRREWEGSGDGERGMTPEHTSHYYNLVVLIIFLCRTFDKILKVIFLVSHWIGHN